MTFKPFHFFALALAGWLNREQQDVIAYLKTENGILREKLGTKRVRLNEQQKCRLAAAATPFDLADDVPADAFAGLANHLRA